MTLPVASSSEIGVCELSDFSRIFLCDKSKNTVNYGMHVILFL